MHQRLCSLFQNQFFFNFSPSLKLFLDHSIFIYYYYYYYYYYYFFYLSFLSFAHFHSSFLAGRMLKEPSLIPWTYIYRHYNIDPTEGSLYVQKYVQKSSKISKKGDNDICPIKKVDNDAICPINCTPPILLI